MKITVFGGAGFLGSHVCDKLSDAGHDVIVFDLKKSLWLRSDQQMIVNDILDPNAVEDAVSGADVVFNFAGIADIGVANEKPADTVRINILGNTIILDACVKHQIKRYVFASSIYVYSQSGGIYRCSKQACELYIECYHKNNNLEYTILRYGSLYGPRTDDSNAIYRFVKEALENSKIVYYGNSNALREYIHVEDAALSSVTILGPQYANESIILTGHQPMRVGDILKMIQEMLGKQIEFDFQKNQDHAHYEITPYSFSPKVGKKLIPTLHHDLGQGILKVIESLHQKNHPDLHNVSGILIEE
jgi:UDP-glucose 4-epimerase